MAIVCKYGFKLSPLSDVIETLKFGSAAPANKIAPLGIDPVLVLYLNPAAPVKPSEPVVPVAPGAQ